MNQPHQHTTATPPAATHIVYLALGANIGKRQDNLEAALQKLRAAVTIEAVSSVYETDPVGYLDQPRFLNLVCRVRTALAPHELLSFVKQIEAELGRHPSFRNAPRPIDIDILLYDDLRLADEDLVIPHPRMHERAFVLVPLVEIAPETVDPASRKAIRELLPAVSQQGIRRLAG